MDFDPMLLPPAVRSGFFTQLELGKEVPLACPQSGYLRMQQEQPGGLLCPMNGLAVSFGREVSDFVLRHHELFSSAVDMPLGNIRPLIPLNIDPPKHAKYRKILDPLFAPKRMDAIEGDVAERANHFIDQFIDRGECNFTDEFAEQFPSAVFLGLMGMPWDELHTFLGLRDGILHPERYDPAAATDPMARMAVVNEWGQKIYAYFNGALDAREANPTDDILTHFITAEVDGDRMTREEILDICFLFLIAGLDTVSDSLTCLFAFLATHPEHRRQIVDDPAIIPAAVEEMLRWESPVPYAVPRVATQDVELPNGIIVTAGHRGHRVVRRGQHRPDRVPRRLRRALRPRAEPPHRVRRRRAPLPRLAPRPPRAAHRARRVAPPHPRLRPQARARGARVPARPPPRQGPHPELVNRR